mmetsp:Transcript_103552/g.163503  ORF Transcript_103552/g.163503 Transcript_103552/m.163503 type:complete len:391 (-) Transcript_103552:326-1498(-)
MASIPEIVEQIGFGPAQYVQLLLMNWTGFSAMCYLMLLMVLAKPIGEGFHISVAQRTNLMAMAGVGTMIGNFSAGPIGDAFGRRRPILGTYFSCFVLGLVNSWSHSYYLSLVLLLGFGFAVGQGQPIKSALGGEIVPSERRLHSRAADFILIALGGGFAVVLVWLDDPNMHDLHWHWLLGMACVPYGIGFICAYVFLHESPSYLSLRCEYEKVEHVLEYMCTMNGKLDIDITNYHPPPPLRRQMSLNVHAEEVEKNTDLIFGKHMWFTTLTLSVGVFTGYLNFFGANYCFLQEMPTVNLFGAPSLNLMVGQLVEIPGILCFVMLGLHIRRKTLSAIGLLGASSGIFTFVAIAMILGQPRTGKIALALQASFFAFKFFVTGTIMTLGTFAF